MPTPRLPRDEHALVRLVRRLFAGSRRFVFTERQCAAIVRAFVILRIRRDRRNRK